MAAEAKKLGLTGTPTNASALRAIKVVKPECQVPVQTLGKTEYTTGPCQQAVAHDAGLAYSWYKTCTHGPKVDSDGKEIPEHLRPYYEENISILRTPVVGEGGAIERWDEQPRYAATLRLTQIALSMHTGGKESVEIMFKKGCKPVSDFGIAPFCEYYNCYRQDIRKFRNGMFCSPMHARLLKAREDQEVLCVPMPNDWSGRGIMRRQKQLQAIDV